MNLASVKAAYQCQSKDCLLIMEAIRRLVEGTWELKDEDRDYTWELLPKVRKALEDHIKFEEGLLMQELSEEECAAHRADHEDLTELLKITQRALENCDSEKFKRSLMELARLLDAHHKEFDDLTTKIRSDLSEEGFKIEEPLHKRVGSTL